MPQTNKKFNFVASPILRSDLGITRDVQRALVRELPSPIYWVKPRRLIMWNKTLMTHLYLVCNGDRSHPEHQRLVEQYLETLPKPA